MTANDWILLELAHDTKAINNQDVYDMISQAESAECEALLRIHYQYLANLEKKISGYG